jgi:hypothetical protein
LVICCKSAFNFTPILNVEAASLLNNFLWPQAWALNAHPEFSTLYEESGGIRTPVTAKFEDIFFKFYYFSNKCWLILGCLVENAPLYLLRSTCPVCRRSAPDTAAPSACCPLSAAASAAPAPGTLPASSL